VSRLAETPLAVGELAAGFPISRPAVSQHLRILKIAGLVSDRAVGTRRIYELNPAGFALLRDYFDSFWGQALDAFKRRVESEESSPRIIPSEEK
jgi:DNA-binding transcriptional ArsR family regulator